MGSPASEEVHWRTAGRGVVMHVLSVNTLWLPRRRSHCYATAITTRHSVTTPYPQYHHTTQRHYTSVSPAGWTPSPPQCSWVTMSHSHKSTRRWRWCKQARKFGQRWVVKRGRRERSWDGNHSSWRRSKTQLMPYSVHNYSNLTPLTSGYGSSGTDHWRTYVIETRCYWNVWSSWNPESYL